MGWWNSLTGLQQIFAYIAIPASIVMVIQFILLLFGLFDGDGADAHIETDIHEGVSHDLFDGHSSGDFEADMDDVSEGHEAQINESVDALRLFTLRGIIAFLSIGGWMGVAAISWDVPLPLVFVLSLTAGFLALYFVAWSLRWALRMQQSGNIIIDNAVGNTGEVYIPIPPLKSGLGKVNVLVQDRLCELSAVTSSERQLKTGEKITVMGVESEGVLLVVPNDNPQ